MKNDQGNYVFIPQFSMDNISDVTFGGFAAHKSLCYGENKLFHFGKTLPEAMILAANMGKGCHLMTSFEWAALAYLWQKAKSLDDLIFDLQAYIWQWNMGLFMQSDGHVDVLASLDVSYNGSPYGRGTVSGSGDSAPALTMQGDGDAWLKDWQPGAFDGMRVYVAEANNGMGGLYPVAVTAKDALTLSQGSDPGDGIATFVIVRHVSKNVTAGMSSGDRINSLSETDPDLKAFAIPATTNTTGKRAYGNDRYWHCKGASIRAAFRGGAFTYEANAGVFALNLDNAPSYSNFGIGFRAAKAL